jgi:para-nitrobenzyl esterase
VKQLIGLLGVAAIAACGSPASHAGAGDAAVDYPASYSSTTCTATITQGGLSGKVAGTTCEYLGVPFGAAPTGSLRFMPPQPAPAWSAPRDASAFGPSCQQASPIAGGGGANNSSEDCLSVNVFTPQAAPAAPLPVMVFLYGGGFTSGASSPYNGALLSERGPVVVVTMNYRLGALGFLALPQLDSERASAPSGSDGIRDQQLGLKWVQQNVATFHGDPTNVTVFGESAGSMSACIHIVSPGSQGLAKRYAMESGACIGNAALLNTQAQAYELSEELAASFCSGEGDGGAADGGDFDATSPDVLACLRAVDPAALMTWVPPPGAPQIGFSTLVLGNQLGAPFTPTVEGPGGVLPDTPMSLIMQGQFDKDAAVLAGTNENEFGLFAFSATSPIAGGSTTSPLAISSTAQLDLDIEQVFGAAAATQIEAVYPSTDATAAQVSIDLYTDYMFRCPTRALARALMSQGTKDYYLYEYAIGKAWHSFELLPLFDFTTVTVLGATTPSPGFAHEMLGYWTQFAATGNPNAPTDVGDAGTPSWPSYQATTDQYLQLLDPTPMSVANLRKTQCDFWDSFAGAPTM